MNQESGVIAQDARRVEELAARLRRDRITTFGVVFLGGLILIVVAWYFYSGLNWRVDPKADSVNQQIQRALDSSAGINRELIKQLSETLKAREGDAKGTNADLARLSAEFERSIALNKEAIEINRQKLSTPPEGNSFFGQFITGSVAVALLGWLGLQRLSKIDGEILSLRESLTKDFGDRAKEGREALEGKFAEARFESEQMTKKTVDAARSEIEKSVREANEEIYAAKKKFEIISSDIEGKANGIKSEIAALLEKYAFLKDAGAKTLVDEIQGLKSVEQAHALAASLNRSGRKPEAVASLTAIVAEKLPGGFDDFHNAQSEAMRMDDPVLARAC